MTVATSRPSRTPRDGLAPRRARGALLLLAAVLLAALVITGTVQVWHLIALSVVALGRLFGPAANINYAYVEPLFKRTWGEKFTGDVTISGISCLVYIAVAVIGGGLIALAVSTGSTAFIIFSVALVVLAAVLILLGVFPSLMVPLVESGVDNILRLFGGA